jgi:hypothetical protein
MYFIRPYTTASGKYREEKGYFIFMQAIIIILALYLPSISLVDSLFL